MSHKMSDANLVIWLNIQMIMIVAKYGTNKEDQKNKEDADNKV